MITVETGNMGKMLYTKRAHLWQHTTRTEFIYPEPLFSFRHVFFKSRVALVTRMRTPRQRKYKSNSITVKFLNKFSFIITFLYLKFHIKNNYRVYTIKDSCFNFFILSKVIRNIYIGTKVTDLFTDTTAILN